jgi:TonB family protein
LKYKGRLKKEALIKKYSMNKTIITFLILALNILCYGQTSQIKYFNTEWLGEEVSQEKAKFSQTIIKNTDGTVTTEVKDLKKEEIIRTETLKGNEPFGTWKIRNGKSIITKDYNFTLIYNEENCNDSLAIKTNDIFKDNDNLAYKAPKIKTGESNIYQFIAKNTFYPSKAIEENIQGTVYLKLTITKEGAIENIVVMRGKNILLDKEAVSVIKQLKLSSPPTINGQNVTIDCVVLPINFQLM